MSFLTHICCSQSLSVGFEYNSKPITSQKKAVAHKWQLKYNEASRKISAECEFDLKRQHCY